VQSKRKQLGIQTLLEICPSTALIAEYAPRSAQDELNKMATITDLNQTLIGWMRWLRLQRALAWSLRGLSLGVVIALALGLVGIFQTSLLREEYLTLLFALGIFGSLIFGLGAYLWPIQPLKAARDFDLTLQLDERVSTALELNQKRSNGSDILIQRQLEDAVTKARIVKPSRDLPLRVHSGEIILALLFIGLASAIWFRGESWFQAARQARAVEQAVAEQTAQIEKILSQIHNDDNLTEEQKQILSAPLEQALQGLQENPSLEGSVSILSSTSEKMQALSDPQAEQAAQALQNAGQELAGQEGSPLQQAGENLAQGNYVAAANDLSNLDLGQLTPEKAQQLADQLQSTAESLQSTNPELASELQNAAEALRNGDAAAAQEALNRAAESLAQTGQQIAASQTAQQAASQLQQGVGEVLAAGGGQAGQPSNGQAGTQPGGSNQNGGQAGGSGSGTGSEGTQGTQPGSEAPNAPIPQNNGPGDGGEQPYEQIYAPSLLGGEDGPEVGLPPDGQGDGEIVGTGPTTPGDPSQSLVPYNEVYSQYEQANRQAVESGSIPYQFMQIIRSYFDSLKP
jgi:hypothetical protein